MTGLYTNSLLNCLRKLLILTLFFQNENYNCLKYLFLINRCGKPNKIICFILYPFNIYTVLYLKIIIVGVFLFTFVVSQPANAHWPSSYNIHSLQNANHRHLLLLWSSRSSQTSFQQLLISNGTEVT